MYLNDETGQILTTVVLANIASALEAVPYEEHKEIKIALNEEDGHHFTLHDESEVFGDGELGNTPVEDIDFEDELFDKRRVVISDGNGAWSSGSEDEGMEVNFDLQFYRRLPNGEEEMVAEFEYAYGPTSSHREWSQQYKQLDSEKLAIVTGTVVGFLVNDVTPSHTAVSAVLENIQNKYRP